MSEDRTKIELEVEVAGTPEEVWDAIATGPGISSWYVPHQVEEREGGAMTASFGDGPEMQVAGRVTAWEPPHRIVMDGGEGVPGLAFEWLIEAKDGGSSIVRLVNTGFGDGAEWDDQYDAMRDGWKIFLFNLQLHRQHFAGQHAVPSQPMGMWPIGTGEAWQRLTSGLGIPASPEIGATITATGGDDLQLTGTVAAVAPNWIGLVLDAPAPGTAFIAAEGGGISIWSYLYGPAAADLVARDKPRWQAWLDANAPAPAS